MWQSVRKGLFISALLLVAANAVAEGRCASKNEDWTCFSTIEIQTDAADPTWRMIIFPTQELLAEIEQQGATKRYLALPSGIQLYSGLSGWISPTRARFATLEEARSAQASQ